eukprot:6187686-Pleurochrysis_carterae.AAC.2
MSRGREGEDGRDERRDGPVLEHTTRQARVTHGNLAPSTLGKECCPIERAAGTHLAIAEGTVGLQRDACTRKQRRCKTACVRKEVLSDEGGNPSLVQSGRKGLVMRCLGAVSLLVFAAVLPYAQICRSYSHWPSSRYMRKNAKRRFLVPCAAEVQLKGSEREAGRVGRAEAATRPAL